MSPFWREFELLNNHSIQRKENINHRYTKQSYPQVCHRRHHRDAGRGRHGRLRVPAAHPYCYFCQVLSLDPVTFATSSSSARCFPFRL